MLRVKQEGLSVLSFWQRGTRKKLGSNRLVHRSIQFLAAKKSSRQSRVRSADSDAQVPEVALQP